MDEQATMGVKDRNTGEIKSLADWSVLHPWSRGPTPRVMFFCNACWEAMKEAWVSPLLGIDRPEHASGFWKPSIRDHIMLTHIRLTHAEKMREADEALRFAAFSEKPMTSRERAMTAEQWKQMLFIRQKFREHAQRSNQGP